MGPASVPRTTRSESAYEWLLRSQQRQAQSAVPHDPSSAAWSFVRPGRGTGVPFIDAALSKQPMSVVELWGEKRTGKSWTLLTLAARFAVYTRPSQFAQDDGDADTASSVGDPEYLPQVVLLDSFQGIVASQVVSAVRTAVLQSHTPEEEMQMEIASCMGRIHVVMADDAVGWVATLEALRCKLSAVSRHPTLLLWDRFLEDIPKEDVSTRMEIIRQATRLLKGCNVLLITSTSRKYGTWDNKLVTQRVQLERLCPTPNDGHEFVATVQDSRIPFSIARGAILC